MELWPLFSIIVVALILIPLIKGKRDGRFTRRKAVAILAAAPILFVLSGLFLANTLVNPADSVQYQIGQALILAASPTLLLSGIIIYLTAPHEEKNPTTAQPPSTMRPDEKPPTSLPEWEKKARKIYGATALLLIGLLVATWSPLMIFIVGLIPYIIFFIYLLRGKRSLVASLFFLLIWYGWFSAVSCSMSPIHFSQILSEVIKNSPYFGPLGYNVWWMFYSVVMFSGVVMLLLSSLSGVKRIERVMARVFTAKTCALILTVPVILMFALPPGFVTNPNLRHPSFVTAQAIDIGINQDLTERYFNDTSGEWVYSIAVRYYGDLIITNVSLGGKVISPPFDNSTVRITENSSEVTSNYSHSGVILIRDKALVNWVSLVSGNSRGEAIYGISWF
ncbi:MAG: hypothetical protein NTV61_07165 [Candidatus Bathyarchaeota archaeon]|nr:hypothetical protein [Candidatus Bathyarchaeota archaeon]